MKSLTFKLNALPVFICSIVLLMNQSCTQYYTTEWDERDDINDSLFSYLKDDTLPSKVPLFDSSLGFYSEELQCSLNNSAAIIRLDAPGYDDKKEKAMATLYPTISDAVLSVADPDKVIPSINVIDAKAKQFNDGLYAALDKAYYNGIAGELASQVKTIESILSECTDAYARAFLAAGLTIAGKTPPDYDTAIAALYLDEFYRDEVKYKPIGFYTWNAELETLFQFGRFFQRTFTWDSAVSDIVRVLQSNSDILNELSTVNSFYAKLTNPLMNVSFVEIALDSSVQSQAALTALSKKLQKPVEDVASLFPASTSVEMELFNEIFSMGIPPDANLMNELIKAIQNGTVDLTPTDETGWYGRQVYALETLLLPTKGEECTKLMFTKNYKKRLLDAFKSIITTYKETHVKQSGIGGCLSGDPQRVYPCLRIEPGVTYYLRTAQAYAFLQNFLKDYILQNTLSALHGLSETGHRPMNIRDEMVYMQELYYGLYLLSCEDIGLKPSFTSGAWSETKSRETAETWLASWVSDVDLSVDMRVSVPVFKDLINNKTQMWGTVGIRFSHLFANYETPPSVKDRYSNTWYEEHLFNCDTAKYLIPVLDFAEFTLKELQVLTREEFRAVCDQYSTREEIVEALENL